MAISDSLIKMANDRIENSLDGEYLVRGAVLKCSYGDQECMLNLLQDHGSYIQGIPQINTQDSGVDNVETFGRCKKNNNILCTPLLTAWHGGNSTNQLWDNNTLTMRSTATASDSVAYCINGEGEIDTVTSGQSFSLPSEDRVCLSSDKKTIIIDGVNYEIYNPNLGDNGEDWYTIGTYSMSQAEFSLTKALTGFSIELKDLTRNEVSNFSYGTTYGPKGNPLPVSNKETFVEEFPGGGSGAATAILAGTAFLIVNDILKVLARGMENTTIRFYFQESDAGEHRVVLLAGTQSDYLKFTNYQFYNRYRSFIYNVSASNLCEKTKKDLKPVIKELIETYYLPQIETGTSKAKLLVNEEDLWLEGNEYYDLYIYLNRIRYGKSNQVFLYSDNMKLCQKKVLYPNDSLIIVKIKPSFLGSTQTDLIELIDTSETSEGNYKFWEIFKRILSDDADDLINTPSNATASTANTIIGNIFNSNSPKLQSISTLIKK